LRVGELDDSDCVILARAGNEHAARELVDRHTPALFRLHRRMLGSREAAEDATQETFLRAFRSLTQFDTTGRFRTWLHTVAWNHARDCLRHRRRRTAVSASPWPADDSAPTGARPDPRAEAPARAAERREEEEWLHRGLEQLRPTQRALLSLREFEGLSYDELAQVFGCRVGTIKSRVHRARMELKDVLRVLNPGLF
jgi:RNA polymerase sigma-70 factor (ECF subfamily)